MQRFASYVIANSSPRYSIHAKQEKNDGLPLKTYGEVFAGGIMERGHIVPFDALLCRHGVLEGCSWCASRGNFTEISAWAMKLKDIYGYNRLCLSMNSLSLRKSNKIEVCRKELILQLFKFRFLNSKLFRILKKRLKWIKMAIDIIHPIRKGGFILVASYLYE